MHVEQTIKDSAGAFAPAELEVMNDSHHHAGHRSSPEPERSHFSVTVVSAAFAGKSRVERHRMVNAALAEELAGRVHALQFSARAGGVGQAISAAACSARVSPPGGGSFVTCSAVMRFFCRRNTSKRKP